MEIAVWIVSGLLAAAYLIAGLMKTFRSKAHLREPLPWTEDFGPGTITFIGIVETLGAIGLIVPWLTGIVPVLTPIAAIGLVVVQILASVVHVRRGEAKVLPVNLVLAAAAAFVAVVRLTQL